MRMVIASFPLEECGSQALEGGCSGAGQHAIEGSKAFSHHSCPPWACLYILVSYPGALVVVPLVLPLHHLITPMPIRKRPCR